MAYKEVLKKVCCIFVMILFFTSNINCFAADKNSVAQKRKETQAKISKLKFLERQETSKMYKNQQKLEKNQKALNQSKRDYNNSQIKLENLERELNEATANYAAYEIKTKNRIRQIYKKERINTFSLILSSKSLNEMLDLVYYQNQITKNDKLQLDSARKKAIRIKKLKDEVANEKATLQALISEMSDRQKLIQKDLNANEEMINKLKTDRAAYEKAERELAKQSQIIEGDIKKLTKNSTVTSATGAFLRPVAGGRITSEFGWRNHPVFKKRKYHSGVDIGVSYGTPIKAANSGKVIQAGWYGGYGKMVTIDHGKVNGHATTTLYAHQSSIAVKVGDSVSKGQVIGYVGSTGYSTGPHLHFEVRIDGSPTNPLNYI